MLSLLFAQTLAFAAAPCSMDKILANPKGEAECVNALALKIKNSEDRGEFKYKLNQWRAPKNLKVTSSEGLIFAEAGGKTLFRALWLKRSDPAVLWFDGKVLTDNSGHQSLARKIDRLFANKTAAFVIPEAFAAGGDETVKSVLFFYSLDPAVSNAQPPEKAAEHAGLANFLPPSNAFFRYFIGPPQIKCADQKNVEKQTLHLGADTQIYAQLEITPRGPDEFVVTGIEKGVTHLIKMNSFSIQETDTAVHRVMHPEFSLSGSLISVCADTKCEKVSKTMSLEERDLLFGRKAEEEAKLDKARSKEDRELYAQINRDMRTKLANRLFAMSILGSCCANSVCQEQIRNRFNVELKATPKGSESSAIR